MHPPVIDVARAPSEDDIIPLSKPVVGISGKVYNELPIRKGTMIAISQFGHNLWVNPRINCSSCRCYPIEIEKSGELMPTNGVRKDGSR